MASKNVKNKEAEIRAGLLEMGLQDSRYVALYRRAAAAFGLGGCQMWILYYLAGEPDGLTQRDIARRMAFPKQTVNSAVAKMQGDGLVALESAEGSRKEKSVRLTDAGRALAERTSQRLLDAEIRATGKLGVAKMREYNRIRSEYLGLLTEAFEADFLAADESGREG